MHVSLMHLISKYLIKIPYILNIRAALSDYYQRYIEYSHRINERYYNDSYLASPQKFEKQVKKM